MGQRGVFHSPHSWRYLTLLTTGERMRGFRRRQMLGFIALLALATQALVAFANTHVHIAPAARAEGLATRAITYGMCRPDAKRPCPPPARHDDHTKCSICLATSLAAAAVLQTPPVIPFRHEPVQTLASFHDVALIQGSHSIHFQARAPPRRILA